MSKLHAAGRGEIGAPIFVAGAEESTGGFEKCVVAVFDVVLAALIAVANGDDADIGASEQRHGDGHALAAEADGGESDFVAGRDEAGTTEDVAGNNEEGGCSGSGALQDISARDVIHRRKLLLSDTSVSKVDVVRQNGGRQNKGCLFFPR